MSQDQTNNAHRLVLGSVIVIIVIAVYLFATRPKVIGTYTGIVIDKNEIEHYTGDNKKDYVEYYIILDSGEHYKISKFIYNRIEVGNSVKINSLSDETNAISKIER